MTNQLSELNLLFWNIDSSFTDRNYLQQDILNLVKAHNIHIVLLCEYDKIIISDFLGDIIPNFR